MANGRLYAIGGYNNSDVTNAVYYTSINANGTLGAWQTNATTLNQGREYHGIETMNGYLYAIAGQPAVSGNPTAAVEVATINANGSVGAFSSTASLPGPRGELATEMVNGYLYALGGGTTQSGGSPQATVYYTTAATASDPTPPTVSVVSARRHRVGHGHRHGQRLRQRRRGRRAVPRGRQRHRRRGHHLAVLGVVGHLHRAATAPIPSPPGPVTPPATRRRRPGAVTVNNSGGAGPRVAYGMNEGSGTTTADSSGNANNATLTSTTWTTPARYGAGLVFNGTSSRATGQRRRRPRDGVHLRDAWVNNPANAGRTRR